MINLRNKNKTFKKAIIIYTIASLVLSILLPFWPLVFGNIITSLLNNSLQSGSRNMMLIIIFFTTFGIFGIFVTILFLVFTIKDTWFKMSKKEVNKYFIAGFLGNFIIIFIPTYIMTIVYYKKYKNIEVENIETKKRMIIKEDWINIVILIANLVMTIMTIFLFKIISWKTEDIIIISLLLFFDLSTYLFICIKIFTYMKNIDKEK